MQRKCGYEGEEEYESDFDESEDREDGNSGDKPFVDLDDNQE